VGGRRLLSGRCRRERRRGEEAKHGQPWTATTWSLNTLREWGLDAAALAGTAEQLAASARWEYDDLPYGGGEVDACINGFTLANGAWLGADVVGLATWFSEHTMPDGGWNCEWVEGSTRSSFHSTLNSLKGILDGEERTGDTRLREVRHAAEEYLLSRRMLYRASTGEHVGPWVASFGYPFRHVYTALNAVDYRRRASLLEGAPPDERASDAIGIIRSAQQLDGQSFPGTWVQERRHPGRVWFELDVPVGEPSPWLTFLSLRVLRWWEARGYAARPTSGSPATVSSVSSGLVVAIERARHGVETRASTTPSPRRAISHSRCRSRAGADASSVR